MEHNTTSRQIRYLATMLALASTYYAVRATLAIPEFYRMLVGTEILEGFSFGRLILEHHYGFLTLVIVTCLATLSAIWRPFKHAELVVPAGIGLQFFLAERAVASVWDPIVQMISVMGNQ